MKKENEIWQKSKTTAFTNTELEIRGIQIVSLLISKNKVCCGGSFEASH